VGYRCSSGEVREEDDDRTELAEGFNSCLGGGGGLTAVDDCGDDILLVRMRLGARRVKNERTTV
jgi:hypothetical protein